MKIDIRSIERNLWRGLLITRSQYDWLVAHAAGAATRTARTRAAIDLAMYRGLAGCSDPSDRARAYHDATSRWAQEVK